MIPPNPLGAQRNLRTASSIYRTDKHRPNRGDSRQHPAPSFPWKRSEEPWQYIHRLEEMLEGDGTLDGGGPTGFSELHDSHTIPQEDSFRRQETASMAGDPVVRSTASSLQHVFSDKHRRAGDDNSEGPREQTLSQFLSFVKEFRSHGQGRAASTEEASTWGRDDLSDKSSVANSLEFPTGRPAQNQVRCLIDLLVTALIQPPL